ncbi:MAG: YdcF family protein [Anaerolineae bacterium]|nr:YdcF family protein [Anaerolineae bacterium]
MFLLVGRAAIVAVSYALDRRARLTPPTQAVMDRAIAEWQVQPDAWLIPSTGDNQRLGVTNARVMADYAVQHGVPAEYILEEDRSSNTWQNLAYSWALAQAHGADRLIVVAYDLHARRCHLAAVKLELPFTLVPATSRATGYAARKPWFAHRALIWLYETLATVYGRLTGRL